MLGNAATFATSTTILPQVPSAWSDGSITVTAATAGFAPGSTAYLYVFDKDNNVNANGYPIEIRDPSAPPPVSLSISDVSVAEGTGTADFTVTLSGPSTRTVSVAWATADGTATAPADYTTSGGTVTFNPGDTVKTISVPIHNDDVQEPDETFDVRLTNPTEATITDGQGTGTIMNDDTPTGEAVELAVASVTASAHDGNVPANTLDGDLNTRWSARGDGQWIQYDLGSAANTVDRVQVAFYLGDQRTQAFDVQSSTDGTSWATVYGGQSSGTTTGLQTFDFADVPARYVRVVGHGNSQSDWNSLTEVAVWGYPPATLDVAAVTASAHDGNVPANTLDGDLNTRWSARGDGQWIQYDLGSIATVDRVQMAFYLGDTRTQAFDILGSTDGSSWTTAFSGQSSGTTTGLQTFDFGDLSARYVRIVGHGNSQSDWNSINEVDIWGRRWTA
jgi:hypothetical protein